MRWCSNREGGAGGFSSLWFSGFFFSSRGEPSEEMLTASVFFLCHVSGYTTEELCSLLTLVLGALRETLRLLRPLLADLHEGAREGAWGDTFPRGISPKRDLSGDPGIRDQGGGRMRVPSISRPEARDLRVFGVVSVSHFLCSNGVKIFWKWCSPLASEPMTPARASCF